jgi:ABC-2 type transport system ATP-binding protein
MLELINVTKNYTIKNRIIEAVNNVSFNVDNNQIVAFVGPNGAGKTTVIKMVCGLIIPDSGEILIDGFNIKNARKKCLENLGVVLDGVRNIHWRLTVNENIEIFLNLRGKSYKEYRNNINYFLERMDLLSHRKKECRFLSRGTQQKVAIVCALAVDPKLLLLDEPTLSLDLKSSIELALLLKEEKEKGKSILISTHDLEFVKNVPDKMVFIENGKISNYGTTMNILEDYKIKTKDLNIIYSEFINDSYKENNII